MEKELQTYKTLEELVRGLNVSNVYVRYASQKSITDMGLQYQKRNSLSPIGMPTIDADTVTIQAQGIGDTGIQIRTIDAKEAQSVAVRIDEKFTLNYAYNWELNEWRGLMSSGTVYLTPAGGLTGTKRQHQTCQ